MNNKGVTGLTAKKKDFEHARGPHVIPLTQLIGHTTDILRHIDNIIGRAKRAPHWGVQSRFRVIYMYML